MVLLFDYCCLFSLGIGWRFSAGSIWLPSLAEVSRGGSACLLLPVQLGRNMVGIAWHFPAFIRLFSSGIAWRFSVLLLLPEHSVRPVWQFTLFTVACLVGRSMAGIGWLFPSTYL